MLEEVLLGEFVNDIRVPLLMLMAETKVREDDEVIDVARVEMMFGKRVAEIEELGHRLGLRMVAKRARYFLDTAHMPYTMDALRTKITDLMNILSEEADLTRFLYLPAPEADYYCEPLSRFSDAARLAFPSTQYDMEEAVRCLALHRWTAAVFHLMRVLEPVIRALWKSIGSVKPQPNTWGHLIGEIKTYADTLPDRAEFYRELCIWFYNVKELWRNQSIHEVGVQHDGDSAELIFRAVSTAIAGVAARVDESGNYTAA